MLGYHFWTSEPFWAFGCFAASFLTIFALIPTKEEVKRLFQTTSSSQWKWWIKGMSSSIFAYFTLGALNVPINITYLIVFLCLVFPWSEQPEEDINAHRRVYRAVTA